MSKPILLDVSLLGRIIYVESNPEVVKWLTGQLEGGAQIVIPEVVDRQVRHTLISNKFYPAIERLDQLKNKLMFLPLTSATMQRAKQLWLDTKRIDVPTTSSDNLDDFMLVAQALEINGIIATEDVGDLNKFVETKYWQDIPTPLIKKNKPDEPKLLDTNLAIDESRGIDQDIIDGFNKSTELGGEAFNSMSIVATELVEFVNKSLKNLKNLEKIKKIKHKKREIAKIVPSYSKMLDKFAMAINKEADNIYTHYFASLNHITGLLTSFNRSKKGKLAADFFIEKIVGLCNSFYFVSHRYKKYCKSIVEAKSLNNLLSEAQKNISEAQLKLEFVLSKVIDVSVEAIQVTQNFFDMAVPTENNTILETILKTDIAHEQTIKIPSGGEWVPEVTIYRNSDGQIFTKWKTNFPTGTKAFITVGEFRPNPSKNILHGPSLGSTSQDDTKSINGYFINTTPFTNEKLSDGGSYYLNLTIVTNGFWKQPLEAEITLLKARKDLDLEFIDPTEPNEILDIFEPLLAKPIDRFDALMGWSLNLYVNFELPIHLSAKDKELVSELQKLSIMEYVNKLVALTQVFSNISSAMMKGVEVWKAAIITLNKDIEKVKNIKNAEQAKTVFSSVQAQFAKNLSQGSEIIEQHLSSFSESVKSFIVYAEHIKTFKTLQPAEIEMITVWVSILQLGKTSIDIFLSQIPTVRQQLNSLTMYLEISQVSKQGLGIVDIMAQGYERISSALGRIKINFQRLQNDESC